MTTVVTVVDSYYLHELLISSHHLIYCLKSFSASDAVQVKEQLPEILKWALFAEAKGLPKSLKHFEAWLAHHFTLYPDAYQNLCSLETSSMVRILLLLKEHVRNP